MYIFAYAIVLLSLISSLICAGSSILQLWNGQDKGLRLVEKGNYLVTACLTIASGILLRALYTKDYTLDYVASYTDNLLPLFYRLTAFWAGQPGSMLFWAFAVALMGTVFFLTRRYQNLSSETRLWFWLFFHTFMAFFALTLVIWNNPFEMLSPAPADGRGLNPLLQNPGMIIHPPLLFLGYGGFTVPTCLALAFALSTDTDAENPWFRLMRPFMIVAWSLLTAGIILGAWWAYMELGWGGYWAWDPVENASLIPWLFATATVHTLLIERHQKKLHRTNIALITLTTVSGFFATYLVRSGVIDSVHAFGQGSVGTPLLIFVLCWTFLALIISMQAPNPGRRLSSPVSREGAIVFMAWMLVSIAFIILVATMWPVFSKLWTSAPQGLDPKFYNRVCVPLLAFIVVLLAVCPWLGWTGLKHKIRASMFVILIPAALIAGMKMAGYGENLPAITTAAAGSIIGATIWLVAEKLFFNRSTAGFRISLLLCHLGIAFCALGIAFSGPYKLDRDMELLRGQAIELGGYELMLTDLREGHGPGYDFLVATISVSSEGKLLGQLRPEKRIYDKFPGMAFSEVDVIPSLGKEVYASLTGTNGSLRAIVKIDIEPLVNWLWIGGVFMVFSPLASLFRKRRVQD